MCRKIAIGIAILMVSATAGLAQDDDYARSGAYIGLAGTAAVYTVIEDELEDALGVSVDVDDAFGVNARAGYRIHPNVAAEVQFEWLSDSDVEALGIDFAEVDSWIITANAKGYILTERFQPFVVLGLGLMQADLNDKLGLGLSETFEDFAMRFGGGLDVYITPNVVGNFDVTYVLPTGDVADLDYVSFSLGFQYRF